MDKHRAHLLVNQYGEAIATNQRPFKPMSALPAPKEQIKKAHLVFVEEIIKELRMLPQEAGDNLVACYSMLDLFVEDKEAERLNEGMAMAKDGRNYSDPEKSDLVREASTKFAISFRNGTYSDEINGHIEECCKKYPKK